MCPLENNIYRAPVPLCGVRSAMLDAESAEYFGNTFIRIPLSGILIKFFPLRALPFDFAQGRELVERRLRGEIVFGQD
jgi:hypothetical protein